MSCSHFKVLGVTVITCGREKERPGVRKVRRCCSCSKLANLVCDGCDRPVCAKCSTGPDLHLDFCPDCARPVFVEWFGLASAVRLEPGEDLRDQRRRTFRTWARANPSRFEPLRSAQSLKVHPRPLPRKCTATNPCVICASGGESCRTD